MKLFMSRKKRYQKLQTAVATCREMVGAYPLSHEERAELCRILFLLMARPIFHVDDPVTDQQLSHVERKVLGLSFSQLVAKGYSMHLVVRKDDRLFAATGPLETGTTLTIGPGGLGEHLKVIDIRELVTAWGAGMSRGQQPRA
jgi:hypothetical protein